MYWVVTMNNLIIIPGVEHIILENSLPDLPKHSHTILYPDRIQYEARSEVNHTSTLT